jgi:energy-coupling factor transporter ATP-binding protein EcfA2
MDSIKDWYKILGSGAKVKEDKTFKNHHIKRNMMIALVGPTGCGKSTILCELLYRKSGQFSRVVIFTGSTSDEPLLNGLQKCMDGIEILDDAEQLPNLDEEEADIESEKLMVFDDFINMKPKELKQIQKWFNSSRKYGWTCMALAQDLTSIPMQIRRNIMIWMIFRLRDAKTVTHLLSVTNVNDVPIEKLKDAFLKSTETPKNFFKIDMTENGKFRYSHNFIDFIE